MANSSHIVYLPRLAQQITLLSEKGNGVSNTIKFTPMLKLSQGPSFYGINLIGISVGGRKLSIPTSIFSTVGTIIDSGWS